MRRSIPIFAVMSVLLFGLLVQPALKPEEADAVTASDWKAGYIIDDSKFTNSSAMSVSQIQSWLDNRLRNCDPNGVQTSELSGGIDYNGDGRVTRAEYGQTRGNPAPFTCLNDYYEVPKTSPGSSIPASNYGSSSIPSGAKSAAQLIYDAGRAYNISPKVLLVKLGTESAGPLTSDTWPFKSQYTYAMGARCPDSGPGGSANCDTDYAGFSLQMREAAKLLRWYLDNMNESWWPYKKPFTSNYILWNVVERGCGGSDVYIKSKATAALYTYTPYQPNAAALNNMYGTGDNCSAYGNRNFWRVYNDWFGPTTSAITSYLSTCSGQKYLIETTESRKRLVSDSVATNWGLSSDSFSYSDYGCSLPTFDLQLGELIRSRQTGDVYYVFSGKAYRVNDQQVANHWGLGSLNQLPKVNGATLYSYLSNIDKVGLTNITTSDNTSISTHYLIVDGARFSIADSDIGNNDVLRMVSGDTIIRRNTLPVGLIQLLPSAGTIDYHFTVDGELYVFDFGKTRKIESTATSSVIQNEPVSPVPLDSSVLSLYKDKRVLRDTFVRDGYYYKVNSDESLTRSNSKAVLSNISPSQPEAITRLLTARLSRNSTGVTITNQIEGNLRLITCDDKQYLVERFIRVKRELSTYAADNWQFNDYHFFSGDRGCAYPAYGLGLDDTIRSRTTGKVYQIIDGIAYYIKDQETADSYSLGNYRAATYPMMEGASINDNLEVVK